MYLLIFDLAVHLGFLLVEGLEIFGGNWLGRVGF